MENKKGFRLLTEYHSFLCLSAKFFNVAASDVSVSLRSIIHSYKKIREKAINILKKGFRLLTEYHSFLLKI